MSSLKLTKVRMSEGVWEGVLPASGDAAPVLAVTHQMRDIPGVTVTRGADGWVVRVPVPANVLGDGVQTFIITEKGQSETLASFSIICGDPLSDDIRAELDLMRAELDLLKQAFRRHCRDTA